MLFKTTGVAITKKKKKKAVRVTKKTVYVLYIKTWNGKVKRLVRKGQENFREVRLQ